MKNLLKTIGLVILLSISKFSFSEEVKLDYSKEYVGVSLTPTENIVIAYNDSTEHFSQNKDIRSCKLNNKTACRIFNYLSKSNFKDYQKYAIITSAFRESTLNPNVGIDQYGLFQWNKKRQKLYSKTFHRSIKGTSIEQQIDFFLWELKNTEIRAYKALLNSNNFQQASVAMVRKYERSLNQQSDISKQNKIYRQLTKVG